MKKMIALLLVLVMVASMIAACGKKEDTYVTTVPTTEGTTAAQTEETPENAEETVTDAQAADVLSTLWDAMEGEKPEIMGGHRSAEIIGTPADYDLTYTEDIQADLMVPAEQVENISQAASFVHLLRAENLTCGAFLLKEGVDAEAFVEAMRTNIQGNKWVCGWPEQLVIAQVNGTVVVTAFGAADLIESLNNGLKSGFEDVDVLYNEEILG